MPRSPFLQLPTEDEVVGLCRPHLSNRKGIRCGTEIWIKFGIFGRFITKDEVYAQIYAFEHADFSILSIPQIYHWFDRDGIIYILMQHIDGKNLLAQLAENPPFEREVIGRRCSGG